MLIEFKGIAPDVSQAAYIAENATICGDFVGGRRSGRCEEDAYIGRTSPGKQ
ncbi:isoleucine patch superfamily enzyme carbonic anhydrase/acetyltransferase [Cryptobacterium sp. CAG:338]|nr:isoleucine patch superfamily enzyme carbonic anhydrase/acetyltransferase [Cryptobacterium sp. CAG:338]